MSYFKGLNAYELHQKLINEYILKRPGDAEKLYTRDTSKDKRDIDVIRENHQFLWTNDDSIDSWEKQLAKRYYDKLFKEYCIADLSRYKENKIALRWRIDREIVTGKGQFECGNKKCDKRTNLRSWEVNFAYQEHGEKKNALIKLRLCPECSDKLNYHSKKREVKRIKKQSKQLSKRRKDNIESTSSATHSNRKTIDSPTSPSSSSSEVTSPSNNAKYSNEMETHSGNENAHQQLEQIFWTKSTNEEEKTREEEFDDYLADLLL